MCKEWNTNKYYIFNIVGMALLKKRTSTNKLLCILYINLFIKKNGKKCEKNCEKKNYHLSFCCVKQNKILKKKSVCVCVCV